MVGLKRFAGGLAAAALFVAPVSAFAQSKGDAAAGEKLYVECEGCHELKENKIGPRHCGVIGRKAGSLADYPSYSPAMKDSGLTWDVKTLSEFLAEPFSYVSGTAMGFIGISDEKARLDLIAYLEKQGKDPSVCPQG